MIKIIAVGKIKKSYLLEGIAYYQKQIKEKLVFCEVEDGQGIDDLKAEEKRILSKITDKDFVIVLAINGVMLSSVDFSAKLTEIMAKNAHIVFVIGGSYGLSEGVYHRADYQLSVSKMTFPHQLMRLILVEQIYRALMIKNNHPYHK